jgi:hypothetical protein
MHTSVLQQSNLTLHATMTTSMFVDRSCFHQATSWMRHYFATTAWHASRWWSPTSTKPTLQKKVCCVIRNTNIKTAMASTGQRSSVLDILNG